MLKADLVPAQQARLATLCIADLEREVHESKESMLEVLAKVEGLKSDKTKLEAQLCVMESKAAAKAPAGEAGSAKAASGAQAKQEGPLVQGSGEEAAKVMAAPADQPDPLRRSTRSAARGAAAGMETTGRRKRLESPAEGEKRQKVSAGVFLFYKKLFCKLTPLR
jgi:hypothetical protein